MTKEARDIQLKRVEELRANGESLSTACELAGIKERTYLQIKQKRREMHALKELLEFAPEALRERYFGMVKA